MLMASVDMPLGWIPFDLVREEAEYLLEWRFLGGARFVDPWLEDTVRRNGPSRNGGFRPRRTAIDILDDPPPSDRLPLSGIIFHASRTGSTLVAQLLSRSPRLCVLAEPPILESLFEGSHARPPAEQAKLGRRIETALAYLGRRRDASEQKLILKVESHHILELPLFERSFPGVPWLFLFRAPEAILRSQRRQRGRQMVPGMIAPGRLEASADAIDPAQLDDYATLVLQRTFEAALLHLNAGTGHAVHYRALPECVWGQIGGLFGLELTDTEVAAMRAHSRYDAKNPRQLFADRPPELDTPISPAGINPTRDRLQQLYARLNALVPTGS